MKDSLLEKNDVAVLVALMNDSRAAEAHIAEIVNIAPKGVGVRTDRMCDEGVIRSMTAKPSLSSLEAKSVLIYGKSRLRSVEQAVSQLGANENVAWIAQSTGGRFYVLLHLKKGANVDAVVRSVEQDAMMMRPVAAIRNTFDIYGPYKFSAMDWKIIHSMREDARKKMEDVAIELGTAQAKVEDRFERMMCSGALELSVDIDLNSVSNFLCLFHIECLSPEGPEAAVEEIIKKHAPSIMFLDTYSNMRQMMTVTAIVQDLDEVKEIMRSFQERYEFAYFEADPIVSSLTLKTWRDKMVLKKGSSVKKK